MKNRIFSIEQLLELKKGIFKPKDHWQLRRYRIMRKFIRKQRFYISCADLYFWQMGEAFLRMRKMMGGRYELMIFGDKHYPGEAYCERFRTRIHAKRAFYKIINLSNKEFKDFKKKW